MDVKSIPFAWNVHVTYEDEQTVDTCQPYEHEEAAHLPATEVQGGVILQEDELRDSASSYSASFASSQPLDDPRAAAVWARTHRCMAYLLATPSVTVSAVQASVGPNVHVLCCVFDSGPTHVTIVHLQPGVDAK